MKKICSLVCMVCVALVALSQNLMLDQEEAEDVIDVVGYFCKNDSMTFRLIQQEYEIKGCDTTISESCEKEFLIVVTDSTSKGYKMKYVPLSFKTLDDNTDDGIMTSAINKLMMSEECNFTTDELGQLQSIDNWREIRDHLKKGVKVVCDSLYSNISDMDSIMSRKEFEKMLSLLLPSDMESIQDSYEELTDLFGIHGSVFDIGDQELDSEMNGFPQHRLVRIGYTAVEDEENDFDGDYAISTKSTTLIPVEDMKDLMGSAFDVVSIIMGMANESLDTDSLDLVRDMIVDSISAAKPSGIEMTTSEYYRFFLNGWPKEYYYSEVIDMGIEKRVEARSIEWIKRNWNIYFREDEDTPEHREI